MATKFFIPEAKIIEYRNASYETFRAVFLKYYPIETDMDIELMDFIIKLRLKMIELDY